MKILGINHLGMAAKDPEVARRFFTEILGLPFLGDELVKEQHTMTTMINSAHPTDSTTGPQTRLELLRPEPSDQGPIAAFLGKKGGGIHHIAFTVASIEDTLAFLKEKGVKMIDTEPRQGAHKTRIAFVHPHATGGFLVEFVEETKAAHGS